MDNNNYQFSEEELYHAWLKQGGSAKKHKYIRREWKNGRWRYYYDSDTSAKPNKNKYYIQKGKGLFDSVTTYATSGGRTVVRNQGKLSRAATAAKKKVYETRPDGGDNDGLFGHTRTISIGNQVISKTTSRGKLERAVTAGKEYIRYLFSED